MQKRQRRFGCVTAGLFIFILFLSPSSALAAEWYVDTGVGNDANIGSADAPFKTLNRAMEILDAGDTLHIGPGTYNETITIFADSDNVTLIGDINGADSSNVILNAGGVRQISGVWYFPTAITALGCSYLRIENLTIQRGFKNIDLQNVDSGLLKNLRLTDGEGMAGAYVNGGSHNRLENLYVTTTSASIGVTNSPYSVLINNWINKKISVAGSDSAQLIGNYLYDENMGPVTLMDITASNHVLVRGTVCNGSGFKTIGLNNCDYSVVDENVLSSGGGAAAVWMTNCDSFTVWKNTFLNSYSALWIEDCSKGIIEENSVVYNDGLGREGVYIQGNDVVIRNNLFDSCRKVAVTIRSGSSNINFYQNSVLNTVANQFSGGGYGLWIESNVADMVVERNNFVNNYLIHIRSDAYQNSFPKNYYGTICLDMISDSMTGLASDTWTPFRFDWIDTSAGADIVAPSIVSGVSVYQSGGAVITWDSVVTDENGDTLTDLAGYRIYRFSDTAELYSGSAVFCGAAGTEAFFFFDGTYTGETDYYYVVTAFDNNTPFENESWYSSAAVWGEAPVELGYELSHDNNCFVITAGFGEGSAVAVEMRRFRDEVLLANRLGRALVIQYYQHGPRASSFIETHGYQTAARVILAPVIAVVLLFEPVTVILFLLLLGLFVFAKQLIRIHS